MKQVNYSNLKTDCQLLASFKYLKPYFKGKRVLDIGCATGSYLEHFSGNSLGIDISKKNIEIAKAKGLNVKLSNIEKSLPFSDNEFEVVFCAHVLEHVDSPIKLLQEISRILKEDGSLIIGLPTEISLARLFNDHYFKSHRGHMYSFTISNMKRLLEHAGFTMEKVIIDINWVYKLKLWWLLWLVQKMPPIFSIWWSNAFWVIGKKSE